MTTTNAYRSNAHIGHIAPKPNHWLRIHSPCVCGFAQFYMLEALPSVAVAKLIASAVKRLNHPHRFLQGVTLAPAASQSGCRTPKKYPCHTDTATLVTWQLPRCRHGAVVCQSRFGRMRLTATAVVAFNDRCHPVSWSERRQYHCRHRFPVPGLAAPFPACRARATLYVSSRCRNTLTS